MRTHLGLLEFRWSLFDFMVGTDLHSGLQQDPRTDIAPRRK